MHVQRKNISNDFELFLLILIAATFFLFYGPVSHVSALRGFNLAPYITTPIDWVIPLQPFWILFYSSVEIVAILTILLIRAKIGEGNIVFRKITITIIMMLLIEYCLNIIFPTSVIEMYGIPKNVWSTNLLNLLAMDRVSERAPWNSTPSIHVALSWLSYRFFATYYEKIWQRAIFLFWFTGVAISTVTLKINVLLNIIFGVLIAEFVFRYVFLSNRAEAVSIAISKIPYGIRLMIYCIIISTLLVVFYALPWG